MRGKWGSVGRRRKRLRRVLCGLLLRRFLEIRFLYALADTFAFARGLVLLGQPVTGHFLRDFITGLILFYVFPPPIRALARAQYSALISIPI